MTSSHSKAVRRDRVERIVADPQLLRQRCKRIRSPGMPCWRCVGHEVRQHVRRPSRDIAVHGRVGSCCRPPAPPLSAPLLSHPLSLLTFRATQRTRTHRIHPRAKLPVGRRLARAAFNTVYGGKESFTGPTCRSSCAHAHARTHARTHTRTHARTYACTYTLRKLHSLSLKLPLQNNYVLYLSPPYPPPLPVQWRAARWRPAAPR